MVSAAPQSFLARSDELHEKVQEYISRSTVATAQCDEEFFELAKAISNYQQDLYPRLTALGTFEKGSAALLETEPLPWLPVDALKLTALDQNGTLTQFFATSGTTLSVSGKHYHRRLDTYKISAMHWGEQMLRPRSVRLRVLCLAPTFSATPHSSLGQMMSWFAESWDTESARKKEHPSFFLQGDKIDVEAFKAEILWAKEQSCPVLILATSFALVYLLDELGEEKLALPSGSRIMMTGGYKGRSRVVEAVTLRSMLCETLKIDVSDLIDEYGMTELSAQLYSEPAHHVNAVRKLRPPPWLRVFALKPNDLTRCAPGEVGWAAFIDLSNVDSSVCMLTQDRIRLSEDGSLELLGRDPSVALRGCSLLIENYLGANS